LPRRQEGLERRVNLCQALLVRKVSSPGIGAVVRSSAQRSAMTTIFAASNSLPHRVVIFGSRLQIEIANHVDFVMIEK
jgi:hypothetical protein